MPRLIVVLAVLAVLCVPGVQAAHAQSGGLSLNDESIQDALGLLGGISLGGLNNVSGVSAPSIAIGSGAASNTSSLSGFVSSLFNPGSSLLNLTSAQANTGSLGSLFESLFGTLASAVPSGTSGSTPSLSQLFSQQNLNLAPSFSSSIQNILAPLASGASGQDWAGLQTSVQNNLSALQPVTALQGSASSVNTTTNNGFTLSISGFSFNFAD